MHNRKQYKIILVGLIFLLIFFAGFVMFSYILRPVTNSRKNICGFYAEPDNSLDMVYIGGSACYTFWEPLSAWNEYGFTSYNFATDALQPQSIKYMIKEIQKTQTPELLVVDLRPFQYGDVLNTDENVNNMDRVAPFRNVSDNLKYSWNRLELIQNGAPVQEEKWTYIFDIAKYHSNMRSLFSRENWKYIFNVGKSTSKGFIPYTKSQKIRFEDSSLVVEEMELSQEINAIFDELLEYCKQENLQVLFIVHAYSITGEDQKKYNYMERKIKEYGHDFLNVNDYFYDIGFDVKVDFHDWNHVNLSGADKYTSFLAEYIAEHYNMPDKKTDLKYESWDADYKIWWEETEDVRKQMLESIE